MKHYKILIVEDDINISELIVLTLRNEGYELLCAEDGKSAVESIMQHTPDLVVLDILIPELDGWQVYKLIRENPLYDNVNFLILTALPFTQETLRYKNVRESDGFLSKPFEIVNLRNSVDKMLTQKIVLTK